eukprot:6200841-Amphidinium_carterae.4
MAVKDCSILELPPKSPLPPSSPASLSTTVGSCPSALSVASSSAQASGFQGTSAAKHSVSSGCTHSKRNAPAISRLANSISTPGSCDPHQRIWRATCLCLGCKAGGWRSEGHSALMARWSWMSLRAALRPPLEWVPLGHNEHATLVRVLPYLVVDLVERLCR